MKIKPFIHISTSNFKNIAPIRKTENKFGVMTYFYLINNSNLEDFKNDSSFKNDFKEQKQCDLEWFLNRWAVNIVSNTYLLNEFLKKDIPTLLRPENWTKRNVII